MFCDGQAATDQFNMGLLGSNSMAIPPSRISSSTFQSHAQPAVAKATVVCDVKWTAEMSSINASGFQLNGVITSLFILSRKPDIRSQRYANQPVAALFQPIAVVIVVCNERPTADKFGGVLLCPNSKATSRSIANNPTSPPGTGLITVDPQSSAFATMFYGGQAAADSLTILQRFSNHQSLAFGDRELCDMGIDIGVDEGAHGDINHMYTLIPSPLPNFTTFSIYSATLKYECFATHRKTVAKTLKRLGEGCIDP
ncbi:hypothetical protein BD410DRAFT_880424 [Rickenella mellea]|uniref:Uncharacterized protein n=1 Tax=Rickenella mellea TaxID=50990 RepID=A0A4Y7PV60_9AGAM|nr:hypothetical protein BD410DRAFT_880424 [Rickenella mellea]